jgi:hypothetical protein
MVENLKAHRCDELQWNDVHVELYKNREFVQKDNRRQEHGYGTMACFYVRKYVASSTPIERTVYIGLPAVITPLIIHCNTIF